MSVRIAGSYSVDGSRDILPRSVLDVLLSFDPVPCRQRGDSGGNTAGAIQRVEQRSGISPRRCQKVPKQGRTIGWGSRITEKLRRLRSPRVADGSAHITGSHVSGGRRTPVLGAGAE